MNAIDHSPRRPGGRTVRRAALVSLSLGVATIGCTPSTRLDHVAALSDAAHKGDAPAARAADQAHAALDAHEPAVAVRFAERAVAFSPNDADYRRLLGQAYLAAGRFAAAQASFRDTLTLVPDQPRARFDLALAQVGGGSSAMARATLASIKGQVPDADLGLALVLAGDRQAGIALLSDVVRAGQSDARARQNLALALALDGQWPQARAMAMQDTPPDRIDDKLAGWALMAQQATGAEQVATLLGTSPAPGDPGLPTQLALAKPAAVAPVALALAAPPMSVPVKILPATIRPVALAPDAPTPIAPPVVPVMLAAMPAETPHLVRPVAMIGPAEPRAPLAPGPLLVLPGPGGYVVQLGAYARADALNAAWARAARLTPRIATLSPVEGRFVRGNATLVRLSIGHFASREEAATVCAQIKGSGGTCFVRAQTGDRPWQWARNDARRPAAIPPAGVLAQTMTRPSAI